MTEPKAERESITPTEDLVMEVLAARTRLGETLWTFETRPAIVAAIRRLSERGLAWTEHGIVEKTIRAGLTEKGRSLWLNEHYRAPALAAAGPLRRPSPYPNVGGVRSMLTQLKADRAQSSYWQARWAEDHTDSAIEAWLDSLLDWLGGKR